MIDLQTLPSPLPDSPRIVYSRNPLVEVVCQLRFPPILRITSDLPADFQDRIRSEYPLLSEKFPEIDVPAEAPPALAKVLRGNLRRQLIGYDFKSEDGNWTVGLTREFIALSTSKYVSWAEFQRQLEGPLNALIGVYNPSFFTRIGLRYQDLIQRSKLDLTPDTSWATLVRPSVAGVLATPELGESVSESQSQVLLRLPVFGGRIRMNYGLVSSVETDEECFLIDSDFYTEERTRINDAANVLAYFNKQSGKLFRWCIEDRLHEIMDPRDGNSEV